MESLVYLSQSDDAGEASGRRPTPLDPEYWRGVTHSYDSAPNPAFLADNGGYAALAQYGRPVTAPPPSYYGTTGGLVTSPVHYQDTPHQFIPVSPVATSGQLYSSPGYRPYSQVLYTHSNQTGASPDWTGGRPGTNMVPPYQLKAQLREAFVHAQVYLDLLPFFQSCDPTCSGGMSAHTLQESLSRMGVTVSAHLIQTAAQLFSIPGRGVLDYVALSRFIELDSQEMYVHDLLYARYALCD